MEPRNRHMRYPSRGSRRQGSPEQSTCRSHLARHFHPDERTFTEGHRLATAQHSVGGSTRRPRPLPKLRKGPSFLRIPCGPGLPCVSREADPLSSRRRAGFFHDDGRWVISRPHPRHCLLNPRNLAPFGPADCLRGVDCIDRRPASGNQRRHGRVSLVKGACRSGGLRHSAKRHGVPRRNDPLAASLSRLDALRLRTGRHSDRRKQVQE